MTFANRKSVALSKADKSRKGEVDERIKGLVNIINSKEDFFTTSSCSGRIMLLHKPTGRKDDVEWVFMSHDRVEHDVFREAVSRIKEGHKGDVWLKVEPAILHIACRDIAAAERMMKDIISAGGFKRSGIISVSRNIMIEVMGTDNIEALFARDGKVLYKDDAMEVLVAGANMKLSRNHKKIDVLSDRIR